MIILKEFPHIVCQEYDFLARDILERECVMPVVVLKLFIVPNDVAYF